MSRRLWLTVLAVLAGINLHAAYVRHDGTFSHEVVRETFRTDTTAGKAALCIAWAWLTAWAVPHWCRWPADKERR